MTTVSAFQGLCLQTAEFICGISTNTSSAGSERLTLVSGDDCDGQGNHRLRNNFYLRAVEGEGSEAEFDFVQSELVDPGFVRNYSSDDAQGILCVRLGYGVPSVDSISDYK